MSGISPGRAYLPALASPNRLSLLAPWCAGLLGDTCFAPDQRPCAQAGIRPPGGRVWPQVCFRHRRACRQSPGPVISRQGRRVSRRPLSSRPATAGKVTPHGAAMIWQPRSQPERTISVPSQRLATRATRLNTVTAPCLCPDLRLGATSSVITRPRVSPLIPTAGLRVG